MPSLVRPFAISITLHSQSTPLHQAAYHGHLDVARLLVERGARLDMRDIHHDATPLDWALEGRQSEVEAYLRSRGAPRGRDLAGGP